MQIIIPMAGVGNRFLQAGYSLPKPLIPISGLPMVQHVSNLFPKNNVIYICNQQHFLNTNMKQKLKRINKTSKLCAVKYAGKGPVDSTLRAENEIANEVAALVNYCDFNMLWDHEDFSNFVSNENLDGAIVCYRGFHPHLLGSSLYASVLTDDKNNFIEIREKYSFTPNKMDSWQSCGTYYFKSGTILKKYFKELVKRKITTNDEFYVSMVYNLMHKDGLKIKVYPIDFFCQWGTPEDLEEYLYWESVFDNED